MHQFSYDSQKNRLKHFKVQVISPNEKKRLHHWAIQAIIRDNLSFGVFKKKGMAKFVSELRPGYSGPNRRTVRVHLTNFYYAVKAALREYFQKVLKIALTGDLWKASTLYHYLTLTAHWFDSQFFYHSTVLGFRIVYERHLAKNLANIINFELKDYHISPTQISSITTDNGGDMKKAAKSCFNEWWSCLLHILNLIVQNGLGLWSKKRYF